MGGEVRAWVASTPKDLTETPVACLINFPPLLDWKNVLVHLVFLRPDTTKEHTDPLFFFTI